MKKVFIVLLIAAVGVGVYFYFSKKQKISSVNSSELIVGKWKVDSLVFKKDTSIAGNLFSHLFDSSLNKYEVEFRKDSLILKTYEGRVEDTSRYQFSNDTTLFISSINDGDKEMWNITRLDSSVMIARDKDSAAFYFKRIASQ
jgi:hypothetical protein